MLIYEIYKKQRNFYVNLLCKTKSLQDLQDKKEFWKTIEPYFSNKPLNSISFSLMLTNFGTVAMATKIME